MTPGEELRDLLLRHQVNILRYGRGFGERLVELLDATEGDLRTKLERGLVRLVGRDPSEVYAIRRMEALIADIGELRDAARQALVDLGTEELSGLMAQEAAFMAKAIETTAPVILELTMPPPELLDSLINTRPFEGRIMSEWASQMMATELAAIQEQLTIGMLNGETIEELTARIIGTAALGGADGITQQTRNAAMSIARTAANTYSNAARDEVMGANTDIIQEEQYHATLDSRTTPICRALDGNRYQHGEGPHPPQHWNCRSIRIPILNGDVIGNRPMREFTEQQLEREWQALPDSDPRTRRQFFRERMRELTSVTSGNLTYAQWISRQPAWFQDDVLGAARGRLFRDGGLTLDRFVDYKGRPYTLAELRKREAAAWKRVFGGR